MRGFVFISRGADARKEKTADIFIGWSRNKIVKDNRKKITWGIALAGQGMINIKMIKLELALLGKSVLLCFFSVLLKVRRMKMQMRRFIEFFHNMVRLRI